MESHTDDDVRVLGKRMSEIMAEIDKLTAQIQPVLDRLKELRAEKAETRSQLEPAMKVTSINNINTPACKITFKAQSLRIRPYNKDLVKDAAKSFFASRGYACNIDDFVDFVDGYRKQNKQAVDKLMLTKARSGGTKRKLNDISVTDDDDKEEEEVVRPFNVMM